MYLGDVDLPAKLIEAHASGNLVIFVGAGASMAPPSSLPNFKDLVKQIRDEGNLAAVITDDDLDEQPLEEILGKINDEHKIDVHRRIREISSRNSSRPAPLHKAIVNLACSNTARLITTNYDRHLATLLDERGDHEQYLAPALPMGDDFTGLVYIHTHVDQNPRRLVATDEDFGKAYLNDAWAARFLDRMFLRYPVLFVGYSHNDTIMKYLARGLGGRSERRYAFTASDDDTAFWRRLGITPIICPHGDQPKTLSAWATRSSEGLMGSRSRVKDLVANQDPSPVPEAVSYLETVLGDTDMVRFFCEYARGPAWLQWVESRPQFATLFHPSPNVDPEITRYLATWFADNYVNDDEVSDAAFQIVADVGGHLGSDVLFYVGRQLAHATTPLSERMRRWLLVIANNRDNRYTASFLGSVLNASSMRDDPDTALFVLDYLSEPMILPARGYSTLLATTFSPSMRDSDRALRDLWQKTYRSSLNAYAPQFIDIVERHIRRADLQLATSSDSDRRLPSDWRPSISVADDDLDRPLGFLVDVARDCIDHLSTADASAAAARIDAWANSDVTLLKRLAVYAWTIRSDKSETDKLRWLLDSNWLQVRDLRSETTNLVITTSPAADIDCLSALVEDIRAHSDDEPHAPHRAHNLLAMIADVAEHAVVTDALSAVAEAHPEVIVSPPEPPPSGAIWAAAPPSDKAGLHQSLTDELGATSAALVACASAVSNWDDERRWDSLAGAIAAVSQEWPNLALGLLDAIGSGNSLIDEAIVRGLAGSAPPAEDVPLILMRVSELQLQPILDWVTAMLGGFGSGGTESMKWHEIEESEVLAKRCWNATPAGDGSATDQWIESGYAATAFNQPAGRIAQFWVSRLGFLWRSRSDSWGGIPADTADYLAELISEDTPRSEAVRIAFCRYVHFFHQADQEWCEQYLFPLLDWEANSRAGAAWSGFLSLGSLNRNLLSDGLLTMLVSAVSHGDQLDKDGTRNLPNLLAKIATTAEHDPRLWIRDIITAGNEAANVAWTRAVRFQLDALEPEAVEAQWQQWIRDYMSDRAKGVPRTLDPRETSALANWILFLTDSMSEAIDLIVEAPAAAVDIHDLFFHDLSAIHVERDPERVARLVLQRLDATPAPFQGWIDLKERVDELRTAGAGTEVLTSIAEAALRLGISLE